MPYFWAYLGIFVAFMVLVLVTIDPGLLRERLRPAPGGKDRRLRAVLAPFALAHFAIAALDVAHFHWSDTVPPGLRIAGLAGVAMSLGLVGWAMAVNRYFSPVVRIQDERGHHVVEAGPYRYVRHPGYLGMVAAALCSPLAIGSWWSMAPIGGYLLFIIRRAALEDRFLRDHLPGYAEYAAKVRYRMVPGLW